MYGLKLTRVHLHRTYSLQFLSWLLWLQNLNFRLKNGVVLLSINFSFFVSNSYNFYFIRQIQNGYSNKEYKKWYTITSSYEEHFGCSGKLINRTINLSPFFAVDYSLGIQNNAPGIPSPETIHYSNLIRLQDAVIMLQIFSFFFFIFIKWVLI